MAIVATVDDALDSTRHGDRRRRHAGRPLPPEWRELLKRCISPGCDVENGLHEFLAEDEELRSSHPPGRRAPRSRRPPPGLDCRPGRTCEQPARVVLTVGSDCAIGKKTVALELDRAARARGMASEFVPTGQTGIAIAGWGIAVDAVVADFLAGAAERLVLEGDERGGELLFVEGQGSLVHPAYSGVTLGLVHGSAPHDFVLCHRPARPRWRAIPDSRCRRSPELVDLHERDLAAGPQGGRACIALNTRDARRR